MRMSMTVSNTLRVGDCISWSPNGRHLAVEGHVFDLSETPESKALQVTIYEKIIYGVVYELSWSTDSKFLLIGLRNENEVYLWDSTTRETEGFGFITEKGATRGPPICARWIGPRRVAVLHEQEDERNYEQPAEITISEIVVKTISATAVNYSEHDDFRLEVTKSGNAIAYSYEDDEGDKHVDVYTGDMSTKLRTLHGTLGYETPCDEYICDIEQCWSPDGRYLAVSGRPALVWDRLGRAGNDTVGMGKGELFVGLPAWSPCGQMLVMVSHDHKGRDAYIYTILVSAMKQLGPKPRKVKMPNMRRVYKICWSPDGRQLYINATDTDGHDVTFIKNGDMRTVRTINNTAMASWSPDGSLLAVGRRGRDMLDNVQLVHAGPWTDRRHWQWRESPAGPGIRRVAIALWGRLGPQLALGVAAAVAARSSRGDIWL